MVLWWFKLKSSGVKCLIGNVSAQRKLQCKIIVYHKYHDSWAYHFIISSAFWWNTCEIIEGMYSNVCVTMPHRRVCVCVRGLRPTIGVDEMKMRGQKKSKSICPFVKLQFNLLLWLMLKCHLNFIASNLCHPIWPLMGSPNSQRVLFQMHSYILTYSFDFV